MADVTGSPIVPHATFLVRCIMCGFAHDSAQPTLDDAIAEMRLRHPSHDHFGAVPYPVTG